MQYEIFCSTQWLENKWRRLEFEKKKKTEVIKEVSGLRKKISDLKVNISTITKGIPIMAIEVYYIGTNNCYSNAPTKYGENVEADQISDASAILGVVKIKHNY